MAEAINNLYKTELIRQQGPWRTVGVCPMNGV